MPKKMIGVFVAATLSKSQNYLLTEDMDIRRDGSSSFGVTVHLGHNNGTKVRTFLEGAGLRLSRLT